MVLQTRRLSVRKPTVSDGDIDFFFKLWNNPEVMTLVGFPNGLDITRDQIKDPISKTDDSEYDKKLLVQIAETGELIGECKLGAPDDGGISMTDVKLLPEFWGCGYGTEIKQGLVDYLFTHTSCKTIRATPNLKNIASQKMQEAVGGEKGWRRYIPLPGENANLHNRCTILRIRGLPGRLGVCKAESVSAIVAFLLTIWLPCMSIACRSDGETGQPVVA